MFVTTVIVAFEHGDVTRSRRRPVVVTSTVGRGLLTAINWVVRPGFDEKVFSNPQEALPWLVQRNSAFDPDRFMQTLRAAVPELDTLQW